MKERIIVFISGFLLVITSAVALFFNSEVNLYIRAIYYLICLIGVLAGWLTIFTSIKNS